MINLIITALRKYAMSHEPCSRERREYAQDVRAADGGGLILISSKQEVAQQT